MQKLVFSSIASFVGAAGVLGISMAFSAGVLEQPPLLKIGAFVALIATLVLFLIGIGNIREGAKQWKAARKEANEVTDQADNRLRLKRRFPDGHD